LNKLKHLLARYSAFLWALLKPLGAWGVMVIAMLDGGFIGLPMDAVIAAYVYNDRGHFLWYAVTGAIGSAIGSIVVYIVGYLGGENFLRKRIPAARFEKIHSAFDKHPFWSLMFPAMLPPPTPFKLFALAAAVSEMTFARYLLAIFCGRLVRFMILAVLTLEFGPDVVHLATQIVSKHLSVVLIILAAAGIGWLLHRRASKQGQPA
jgi:membrane protein YqaA with SNARE-associated domain